MKNIIWLNGNQNLEDDDEEENEDDPSGYGKHEHKHQMPKMGNIIQTPLGIFRVDQVGNPYTNNEIWQGMVNFDITQAHADAIEAVEGIEGLRIISRYTFVICVGVLFDDDIIRFRVESALGIERINVDDLEDMGDNREIPSECLDKINEELIKITAASKFWTLYCFPNGQIRSMAYKNEEEYEKGMQLFIQLKRLSYGILLTSDEGEEIEEVTDSLE